MRTTDCVCVCVSVCDVDVWRVWRDLREREGCSAELMSQCIDPSLTFFIINNCISHL